MGISNNVRCTKDTKHLLSNDKITVQQTTYSISALRSLYLIYRII